jgi:probable F420-dependent oxidoreductase
MTTNELRDPTRLGGYVLPGRVSDPRPAIGQARAAEHLGLGSVWISERWGTKDLAVLAGAIGQATDRVRIASGITHFLVRHPAVLASTAMTLQALTGGRFTLGVGRSTDALWKAVGLPRMSNDVLVDSLDMFRRLCRGEKVSYEGPAGRFPKLRLGDLPQDVAPPPVLLAAIGPRTLALAGRHFDGVILHPFLTPEAVAASAALVHKAAEEAGRDPAAVRIHAEVVTAPDLTDEERTAVVGARAVTYFQIPGFGETLARANGWDTAALAKLRAHPLLAGLRGAADNHFTRHDLLDVANTLPVQWLQDAAAAGSAGHCAERLRAYREAGADELVLHGATPELLGPTLQHFASGGAAR